MVETQRGVHVEDCGARGDGRADDTAAFARAMAGLATDQPSTLHVPDGVYLLRRPLVLPHEASLALAPSATLRAAPDFQGDALVIKGREENPPPGGAGHRYGGRIFGGIIDANEVPGLTGVLVERACRYAVHDLEILNAPVCGLHLGTRGWYEGTVYNVRIARSLTAPGVPGSVGLRIEKCSDNHVSQVVVIAYETGIWASGSSTAFSQLHCWHGGPGNPMRVGYRAAGWQDFYSQCHADCPAEAGFRVEAPFQRFLGCMVQGGGPEVTGFRIEARGTHGTYLGNYFLGRVAKPDDRGTDLTAFAGHLEAATILGSAHNPNVVAGQVAQLPSDTGGISRAAPLQVVGTSLGLPVVAETPGADEGEVGELRVVAGDADDVPYLRTRRGWRRLRLD